MTITWVGDGWWELHTRHGIFVSSGSLYAMVCLWARMKRDWWCDLPYGAGAPGVDDRVHVHPRLQMPGLHGTDPPRGALLASG
jgi:hypothetical protein